MSEPASPAEPREPQPTRDAEHLLGRRVPPADAETAPGDATQRPPDLHYRAPQRPPKDFLDRVIGNT